MFEDARTVFHVVTGNEDIQELVLTLTENLTQDEAIDMDDIGLLAQGEDIEPVGADGENGDQVRLLIEEGVSVKACSDMMEIFDLEEAALVEGVAPRPDHSPIASR